jgi:hypothetical protein
MIAPRVTKLRCRQCGASLVHIPQAQPDRTIACLDCGGIGNYEEVTLEGAWLIWGVLTPEELRDLRRRAGL